MELKHQPLPWGYDGEDTIASQDWDGDGYCIFPLDEDGTCAGFIAELDMEEDAEFITRACNNHYQLLGALQMMVDKFSKLSSPAQGAPDSFEYLYSEEFALARAVIEKATTKESNTP